MKDSASSENFQPKVTVAIPAYKATFLEAAIRSLLSQDFTDYEIVICDDSPDESVKKAIDPFLMELGEPKIRYFKNAKRLWGGGSLSRCIELARGEYIKPLFDDDLLLAGCISTLAAVLDGHPEVSLVSSRRYLVDENGELLPDFIGNVMPFEEDSCVHGKDLVSFLGDNTLNFIGEPSTVMFRREHVLTEIGALFHLGGQHIAWVGDLAMHAKLLRKGHLAMLYKAYSCFRISSEQFSHRGRVSPGVGDKGHEDFRRMIRELGWYRSSDNHLVRVKPLAHDRHAGFEPVELFERISQKHHAQNVMQLQRKWGVPEWLEARAPSPSRVLAIQTMLQANPDVGTLGIAIIVPDGADARALADTVDSIRGQHRRVDGIWVVGKADIADDGIELLGEGVPWPRRLSDRIERGGAPDFLCVLHAGDRLLPHATLVMGEYRLRQPDPLAWYFDEATLKDGTPANPMLKPDFNLDLLRSYPYLGRPLVVSTAAVQAVGGLDADFGGLALVDLVWRLVERAGPPVIGHIPEVLMHGVQPLFRWVEEDDTDRLSRQAVQAHLTRMGVQAEVSPAGQKGLQQIRYGHDAQPLVSIIIPTRDQLPILRSCVDSLMAHTAYARYELLVVDNGSIEPDACAFLDGLEAMRLDQVRVLRWPQPFNYSRLNNYAAQQAKGEVLLFLNNDIQVVDKEWLALMLGHALRPEVGIVGARLNYPDSRVQHGGLVLGMDNSVGFAFQGLPGNLQGYMSRLQAAHNVSAVSAACMMMRRAVYEELGGFDEESFPVYYGDADLCMKATQAGYLLTIVPDTGLIHMGGATRLLTEKFGLTATPDDEQRDHLYAKWLPQLARDPAYHPAFGKFSPGFDLSPDAMRIQEPLPGRPLPVVLASHVDWQGCGHYRIIQPFKALEGCLQVEGGLKLGDFHFTDVARIQPESIVLQGAWAHEGILKQIKRYRESTGAKVALEFDDYMPNIPVQSIYRKLIPQSVIKKMRRAIEQVDWLVVSTPALADEYADYHSDIRIAQNGLYPPWWQDLRAERRAGKKMRIGWAGGSSHDGDLAVIRALVKDMENDVEWVFMGMQPKDIRCEFHPGVPIEQYPQKLASLNLDLAVVPLELNQFNRSKSNLRLLELGACGVPVICTDIEPYRCGLPVTIVRNRYQDWMEAVRSHLAEPEALARQGDALREAVLRSWMLEGEFLDQWARAWLPAR